MPPASNRTSRFMAPRITGVTLGSPTRGLVRRPTAKKKSKMPVRKIKSLNRSGTISIKRIRAAVKAVAAGELAAPNDT